MMEWLISKTLKKLRGFIGLMRYYYKFVKKYGQIKTPLIESLKKEPFSWIQETTKLISINKITFMLENNTIPNYSFSCLLVLNGKILFVEIK